MVKYLGANWLPSLQVIIYACIPWKSRTDPKNVLDSEAQCRRYQRPFQLAGGALAFFLDLYMIAIPTHRVTKLNIPSTKRKC